MRLLLLGASGFLGRHIAHAAERSDRIELIAHARRADSTPRPAVVLDLLAASDAQLDELLSSLAPDAVVNATGATTGDEQTLQALNVRLVARLLDAAVRAAPAARFVQLGSAAEYGAPPDERPLSEETEARPLSAYGETKLAATRLVLDARRSGTPAVVLRIFNPVGRGMPASTLAGSAAAQMREVMRGRAALVRLGPLGDRRDFVAARDVAEAVTAAASAPAPPPIVNVGSGTAVAARDLVRRLAAAARFDGRIVEEASPSGRSSAVAWQQADITLARRALGWQPRHGLDEALRELWEDAAGERRRCG